MAPDIIVFYRESASLLAVHAQRGNYRLGKGEGGGEGEGEGEGEGKGKGEGEGGRGREGVGNDDQAYTLVIQLVWMLRLEPLNLDAGYSTFSHKRSILVEPVCWQRKYFSSYKMPLHCIVGLSLFSNPCNAEGDHSCLFHDL